MLMDKTIKNYWHEINADGKVLGRISVEIAHLLMGKGNPEFTRSRVDIGDNVVVTNASKIKVTGNKETQKIYAHHTGYPQGYRETKLSDLRKSHPSRIIISAVSGMLPQNKLKAKMLKRLHIYPDDNHPYKDKFSK